MRVEASAKSQYRGGKGRRKFVGFVVAGKIQRLEMLVKIETRDLGERLMC